MAIAPGTRLGPYEVRSAIGAGGMGDVYRGRDTRLDRIVAIKVGRQQFTERFEREARAAAALNHPHICHLYDVGPDYLVMEYVDGAPIHPTSDVGKLIDMAAQIADALVAAHAAGVVHRDLKPANILLTRAGQVKILDFGLATLSPTTVDVSAVTRPGALTEVGAAIGTAAYMSPEQARGEPADARSDLWSLGVILYELATSVRPFDGATSAVIFEALLSKTPAPLRTLAPAMPDALGRIVARLLERDREMRYQSAADVRADLMRVRRELSGPAPQSDASLPPRRSRKWAYAAAAIVAVAVSAALALWRSTSASREVPVSSPTEYVAMTNFPDSASAPALSPDGRMVTFLRGQTFLSTGDVYVKLLPDGEAKRLTNSSAPKYAPVFTPDGSRVVYSQVERRGTAGVSFNSWSVPVLGGEPTPFLPNAAGLSWIDGKQMLFSEIKGSGLHMGIVTANANRADKREIYFPEHERAMAHYSYQSPDQQWLLISEMDRTQAFQPCRLMPFDGSSSGRVIGPKGACIGAAWSHDGKWMYFSATVDGVAHLWRQAFPDGSPERITFGPTEEEGIALAPDGRSLVTSLGQRRSAIWVRLGGRDRELSTDGYAFAPQVSLDGQRVYYLRRPADASSADLRVVDVASGQTATLLSGLRTNQFELSADERSVVYTAVTSDSESQIWVAALDRRTPPQLVTTSGDQPSFGPDGDILFRSLEPRANYLGRVRSDGQERRHVTEIPIMNKGGGSYDGALALVFIADSDGDVNETVAVAVRDGRRTRLCIGVCNGRWTRNGRFFMVSGGGVQLPPGETVAVFKLTRLHALPDGLSPQAKVDATKATTMAPSRAPLALDLTEYVEVRESLQRNLFRIPLH